MTNHPNRNADMRLIRDLIAKLRMIGWRINRLQIEQAVGRPTVAHIGWWASDLGSEPSTTADARPGVTLLAWSAPDDDAMELAGVWTDDLMRELCRHVGSRDFDRLDAIDTSRTVWVAHRPSAQ